MDMLLNVINVNAQKALEPGVFFSKTKLSIENVYGILYLWSVAVPGHIMKKMLPSIRANTLYDYMNNAKDICCENVDRNPVIFESIANVEIELQIDESIFGKRQKYHKGKAFKKQWVFGVSEPLLHKCSLEIVEVRSQETLCGLIKQLVPKTAKA